MKTYLILLVIVLATTFDIENGLGSPQINNNDLNTIEAASKNYPNPFNPATRITYELPWQAHVSIRIYNIVGQEIKMLEDNVQDQGEHTITWDGTDLRNRPLTSGVYFYRLEAAPVNIRDKGPLNQQQNQLTITRKMTLIR